MKHSNPASVIWLGSDLHETFRELSADLEQRGLKVEVCENAEDLPEMLRRASTAVLIMRDDGAAAFTEAALAALQSSYRPIQVVVLAEDSAFGRYYDLMARGVSHFYDLREPLSQIGRAVHHTAAHAA